MESEQLIKSRKGIRGYLNKPVPRELIEEVIEVANWAPLSLNTQPSQLVQFDPASMALAVEHAPRVCAWVALTEDLSGLEVAEDGWFDGNHLPASLQALLCEVGRLYAPVLLANAQALAEGTTEVRATVEGQPWAQQAFPYQGKCLSWLRRDHQALAGPARARVDLALAGTGCECLLAGL